MYGISTQTSDHMQPRHLLGPQFAGSKATNAALQAIDNDIDKIQASIQELRRERNDLVSISVLPPEALAEIFIFTRDMCQYDHSYRGQTQWIRMGHICHRWREIALGCPTLWSSPIFTTPELCQEMLRRSKMAPLKIMYIDTKPAMDQVESALTQIFRIQHLELTLSGRFSRLEGLLSTFSHPAPLLETICLEFHGGPPTLPDDVFKEAPRLRSIVFSGLILNWDSPAFRHSSLTVLRLRHVNETKGGFSTTFSQMIDALANTPNLHILELMDSLPPHTTSSNDDRIIPLESLEQLIIKSKLLDCTAFLRHIRYPPCTITNIHCLANRTERDGCSTILFMLGQALRRCPPGDGLAVQNPCITLLDIDLRSLGSVRVALHDNSKDPASRVCPVSSIFFEGALDIGSAREDIFRDICAFFDPSQLKTVNLSFWNFTNALVIRECLGELPNLASVQIREDFLPVCHALREPMEDRTTPSNVERQVGNFQDAPHEHGPSPSRPVTIFPALESLIISGWDFNSEDFDLLIETVMHRCDIGVPIEHLILNRCADLRDLDTKRLAEIVTDVRVDGEQINI